MLSVAASLVFLVVADPIDTSAAGVEPPRLWDVNVGVVGGTAAVLPGVATGAVAEAQHRWPDLPVFLAARLQWSEATGANANWIIDHQQFVAAAAVGLTTTAGAGRLWAELGGGAAGLYEILSRQQIDRIQAAGLPGGTESAFTAGPYAFGEAGVGLTLRGWVRGFIAAGPTVLRTTVDGGGRWRFGASGRLGVAYDF